MRLREWISGWKGEEREREERSCSRPLFSLITFALTLPSVFPIDYQTVLRLLHYLRLLLLALSLSLSIASRCAQSECVISPHAVSAFNCSAGQLDQSERVSVRSFVNQHASTTTTLTDQHGSGNCCISSGIPDARVCVVQAERVQQETRVR